MALKAELADLEARSAQSEAAERRAAETALALDTMKRRWDQGTAEERKTILGIVIERALVKSGEGRIDIEYRFWPAGIPPVRNRAGPKLDTAGRSCYNHR